MKAIPSEYHSHDVLIDDFGGELNTDMSHSHPISEPGHTHTITVGPAWTKVRQDA